MKVLINQAQNEALVSSIIFQLSSYTAKTDTPKKDILVCNFGCMYFDDFPPFLQRTTIASKDDRSGNENYRVAFRQSIHIHGGTTLPKQDY